MHCTRRNLQNKLEKWIKELQISRADVYCFQNRKKLVNCEVEPVVLHTINPMNSTKRVTTFSWIFHFSLIDFSRKIFETFFLKWGMPCGYMELYMVKFHEDAYWLNNLSLFAFNIWGPWDQINKIMSKNRRPMLSSISLEYL